jgi:hypothetical protein
VLKPDGWSRRRKQKRRNGGRGSREGFMGVKVSAAILMAVILVAGCGDNPDRPLRDGYTLQGAVLHAQTGVLVSEVDVLVGTAPDTEFHSYAVTDTAGGFMFL